MGQGAATNRAATPTLDGRRSTARFTVQPTLGVDAGHLANALLGLCRLDNLRVAGDERRHTNAAALGLAHHVHMALVTYLHEMFLSAYGPTAGIKKPDLAPAAYATWLLKAPYWTAIAGNRIWPAASAVVTA